MPGYVVVENIRRAVHTFGCVTLFKAYLEISDTTGSKKNLRSELQSSGVSLTDCPHNGRKDAADKMMIVDMLAFALDHPSPATIVLISGDRDFVYALSTLRNRRYTVVLIVPNRGAHIILKSQANVILEWRYDVLNQDIEVLKELGLLELEEPAARERPEITRTVNRERSDSNRTKRPVDENLPDWRKQGIESHTKDVRSQSGIATPVTHNPFTPLQSISPTESTPLKATVVDKPKEAKEGDEQHRMPALAPPPGLAGSNLKLAMTIEKKTFLDPQQLPAFSPRIPHYFDLLVEVLEKFRLEGDPKPKRSKVGNELVRRNPLLCKCFCYTFLRLITE